MAGSREARDILQRDSVAPASMPVGSRRPKDRSSSAASCRSAIPDSPVIRRCRFCTVPAMPPGPPLRSRRRMVRRTNTPSHPAGQSNVCHDAPLSQIRAFGHRTCLSTHRFVPPNDYLAPVRLIVRLRLLDREKATRLSPGRAVVVGRHCGRRAARRSPRPLEGGSDPQRVTGDGIYRSRMRIQSRGTIPSLGLLSRLTPRLGKSPARIEYHGQSGTHSPTHECPWRIIGQV